ncbi:MAG: hypothetical protein NC124_16405 [Clostridium sp.]|nr:hypothetical protein [Clostridium sp.]
MNLTVISAEEYGSICNAYQYFYNSMQFHELNKNKVNQVQYLLFGEKKRKLALAIGMEDGEIRVPYSAPFSIFEKLQNHIKLEEIEEAVTLLEEYGRENNIHKIVFRIPPVFYDECFISKLQNVLLRKRYQIEYCDLNYQFRIRSIEEYEDSLMRNARKNLKNAIKQDFVFFRCESREEKQEAYNVIAENRKRKGYPLRMTYEQVNDTIQLTEHDFFLLKDGDVSIAAAVIFKVNEECYQVIYWGDIDGYEAKRPMNYLAYKVYEYYVNKGIKILDIGPSTEEGIPNYGLCDFKESIGCEVSSKYTFVKNW